MDEAPDLADGRFRIRNGEQTPEIERRDGKAFIKLPFSESIGGALMYIYRG